MEAVQFALPAESRLGFDREDVVGLAAILALGGALAWLCAFHLAAMPFWTPWEFSWVEFLAAAFGIWWYFRGVARSTAAERPAIWRQVTYLIGIVAIYSVVQTHYDYMAQHEFFLNRIQHIFMHHLGPYLVTVAWPGATLKRGMPAAMRRVTESRVLAAVFAVLQQPLIASLLFVGLIYLFLIPAVHFRAMIDPQLYALMNWLMIGDGIMFWAVVLDPRPKAEAGISYGVRMVMPFAVMFPQIALGAYIAFSSRDIYPYYDLCGRFFPSIGALLDQHIGGIVAWIPAGMMSAVGFMTVFNALRVYEEGLPVEEPDEEADRGRIVLRAAAWTGR